MKRIGSRSAGAAHAEEFTVISQKILRYANRGVARIEFLTEISNMLLESLQCDALELRLKDPDLYYRWEFTDAPTRSSRFTVLDDHPEGQFTVADSGARRKRFREERERDSGVKAKKTPG